MSILQTKDHHKTPIFLVKTKLALIITAVAVIFLTPFSINHFSEGRLFLGLSSLAIVLISALNMWNCILKRYQPQLIVFGLAPCIIISLLLVFQELGTEAMMWSYPAALAFYFMLPPREAHLVNIVLLAIVLPVSFLMVDTYSAIVFTASLILSSIFAGLFVGLISKQQQQLETLAITDTLTGLLNRVMLEDHLIRAIEQNRRNNMPMTLLMMDIDYFKTINDTFGHTIGDDVLRALGTYLQQRVRSSDAAFRLGGEEFLILLNNTQAQDAQSIAEEIRKEIAALKLVPDHSVTISIGVAEVQANDDLNNWLKRGDKTLYKAKLAGRNQVASHYVEDQMLQEA